MATSEGNNKTSVMLGLRIVLIASLVLFLLATVTEMYRSPPEPVVDPTPTERSASDNLIVPGTRIGPMTLGLSEDEVVRLLGKGQMRPVKTGVLHLYENLGLVVYIEEEKVTSVTVRSPQFETRQGIRVGSDIDLVLSHLGKEYELEGNDEEYVLHNWGQGWHVGVNKSLVTYFQVTPPITKEEES